MSNLTQDSNVVMSYNNTLSSAVSMVTMSSESWVAEENEGVRVAV